MPRGSTSGDSATAQANAFVSACRVCGRFFLTRETPEARHDACFDHYRRCGGSAMVSWVELCPIRLDAQLIDDLPQVRSLDQVLELLLEYLEDPAVAMEFVRRVLLGEEDEATPSPESKS